jgi:hypothetical protein
MVVSTVRSEETGSRNFTWYATGVLFAAWVMAHVDRMLFGVLVPGIEVSMHATDVQVSLLQGFAFAPFFPLLACRSAGWSVGSTDAIF